MIELEMISEVKNMPKGDCLVRYECYVLYTFAMFLDVVFILEKN